MAIAALPYVTILIPVLGCLLYFLKLFYLRTSKQLRLLEFVLHSFITITLADSLFHVRIESKAPIASLFIDTIQGLSTIHAFGWGQDYIQKSFTLLDLSQKPYYLLFCVQRWLLLVLALTVAGLMMLVVGLAIALRGRVSASLVGLAIIQITTLTETMSDFVMQWTEMETSLGAVARISGFVAETPQEIDLHNNGAIPDDWPPLGAIIFEHVSAKYE